MELIPQTFTQVSPSSHQKHEDLIHSKWLINCKWYTLTQWLQHARSNVTVSVLKGETRSQYNYYHYNRFTAPWTLSGTIRVSRYQKGKTRKVKPIWIHRSKRQWVVVASAGPYANLHLPPDNDASTSPLNTRYNIMLSITLPCYYLTIIKMRHAMSTQQNTIERLWISGMAFY